MKKGNFEARITQNPFKVLIRTISRYLELHRRLVIPQLGTFIVKEPEQRVYFSELLKRDDGVLRDLLHEQEGISELEAAGEVDRFVFQIRHALEHGEEYPLEGLGLLKPGENGTITFVWEPRPVSTPPTPPAANRAPIYAGRRRVSQGTKPDEMLGDASELSPSIQATPDPSLRGLRYGKPHKNIDAYTYLYRAPKRRTDRFVWIAIVAVVIALAAIAFGYLRDTNERETVPGFPGEAQTSSQSESGTSESPQQDDAQLDILK